MSSRRLWPARARPATSSDYRAALALYGGELLAEDRYEAWAAGRRDALREAHLGLLLEFVRPPARGAAIARRRSRRSSRRSCRPAARGRAPRADADVRRRRAPPAGARRNITGCARRCGASWRRSPTRRPRACIGRCCAARSTSSRQPAARARTRPPRAGRRARRHNLPVALTSFIGRERELREVARLLDRDRLVTLTGAGGCGQDPAGAGGRDGARRGRATTACGWSSWRASRDPALVADATASALGLTLPSRRPALEGLAAQLAEWRALLIARQLRAPGRRPAPRLPSACCGAARRCGILATSREPLRVAGEVDLARAVARAARPGRVGRRPTELRRYESVRLFCERAGDVAPGFALSEDNAGAVAEICLRLDGMPLALELAAARVGALSPAQIAERLGDCLARPDGRQPVGAGPPADAARHARAGATSC